MKLTTRPNISSSKISTLKRKKRPSGNIISDLYHLNVNYTRLSKEKAILEGRLRKVNDEFVIIKEQLMASHQKAGQSFQEEKVSVKVKKNKDKNGIEKTFESVEMHF